MPYSEADFWCICQCEAHAIQSTDMLLGRNEKFSVESVRGCECVGLDMFETTENMNHIIHAYCKIDA